MNAFRVEKSDDMNEACRLIREHRLFLEEVNLSHTLFALEQHEDREHLHTPLLGAWFAFDRAGKPIGCSLVVEGLGFTDGSPTVSLFVFQDWRGQGVGTELLKRSLSLFPDAWGFHTPEAEGMYAREGLETAFFSRDLAETSDWDSLDGPRGPKL